MKLTSYVKLNLHKKKDESKEYLLNIFTNLLSINIDLKSGYIISYRLDITKRMFL